MKASDKHGHGLLLNLDGFRGGPLSLQQLESVYEATDWTSVVNYHPQEQRAYGRKNLRPIAMFKALALPYLIPIESEAALAREVGERDALRTLCGFGVKAPTRPMFWHFRHTPPDLYSGVMPRVLISLVLSSRHLNIDLPFVLTVPEDEGEPQGRYTLIKLGPYIPTIKVWTTPADGMDPVVGSAGKTVRDLYLELTHLERSKGRGGFSGMLGFPIEVRTCPADGRPIRFLLDRPDWLTAGSGQVTRSKDTLTTVGPALNVPYAACNVVVTRRGTDGEHVLLSRRLAGNGSGQYALPGGKAKRGESLEECVGRELEEETGLEVIRSRPISIHRVRLPGRPPVFSVGAHVTEYAGDLRLKEPLVHRGWEWFSLDSLPSPLFLPAYLALKDYRKGLGRGLEWPDMDIQWRRSRQRPDQLKFGGPFARGDDDSS